MNQRLGGWRAGLAATLGCMAAATCGGTVVTSGSGGTATSTTGGAPSTSTASSSGAPATSSSSSGGDAAGRTKLRCTITGTADLGGGPVTSAAGEHVLVALDETGAFAWQKAPFDGRFALDPCGAVIAAEACGTCGPNAAAGVTVAKLAP